MSPGERGAADRGFHRLKRHLQCQVLDHENAFVVGEAVSLHLQGRAYPWLLPRLAQGVSLLALLDNPPQGITAREIAFALAHLRRQGVLNDFPLSTPGAAAPDQIHRDAVFWDAQGVPLDEAAWRIGAARVALLDLRDGASSLALRAMLGEAGLQVVDGAQAATLRVVLVDDPLDERLDGINRAQLAQRAPWMLAKPSGEVGWLGPLFLPAGAGGTGCWQCLQQRLRYRRKVDQYLRLHGAQPVSQAVRASGFSGAENVAFAMLCAEVVKFVALGPGAAALPTAGHVVTFAGGALSLARHPVVRRPQCPACGDAGWVGAQQRRPVRLPPTGHIASREAGLRLQTAQEIVETLQVHVSAVTGIIGATCDVSLPDDAHGVTTSMAAEHNFALLDHDSSFLQERIRGCAGGKGRNPSQVKASALAESIERFSGVYQGDEARTTSRMEDLAHAIHPNDCLLFSEAQFAQRARINAAGSRISHVPEPFDVREVCEWTPLWSLTEERFYHLPTALCFYGHARDVNWRYGRADSNGCAAGSHLAEAIVQGCLELVERDAAALWWYNRLVRKGVALRSFDDPYLLGVSQYFETQGLDFWVLDISSDLAVPCFAALCARRSAGPQHITYAFGAHFDAGIALTRAVSELLQILPNVGQGGARTLKSLGEEAQAWWQGARLSDHPYLLAAGDPHERGDYADARHMDLDAALRRCLDLAVTHGLNLLVLDQTRPDTGLHVAKVVIPSLRHFWPRFAPGRLYRPRPGLGEADLNPCPIFI